MIDVTVIRGAGYALSDVVDPLLGSTQAAAARGRHELDEASPRREVVVEVPFDPDYSPGQVARVRDPDFGQNYLAQILNVDYSAEPDQVVVARLTLTRSA